MISALVVEKTVTSKPPTIMVADVKAQASVLRKNISDYSNVLRWMPPRLQACASCATFEHK